MNAHKLYTLTPVPSCLREAVQELDGIVSQLKRTVAGGFTTEEKLKEAARLLMEIDGPALKGRKALRGELR